MTDLDTEDVGLLLLVFGSPFSETSAQIKTKI